MSRGIVIGQRIVPGHGIRMNGAVQIQDAMSWLLYWDKITYAGVEFQGASISGNQPPDVLFLEQEGIFSTEMVDVLTLNQVPTPTSTALNFGSDEIWGLTNNEFAMVTAAARIELSNKLSERTGDIWTFGQAGGEQLLLPGTNKTEDVIDVQLFKSLPVPLEGKNSFEDVLIFKQKYLGELEALRLAIDSLRKNILSSSDEKRALDDALHEIETALSDIQGALQGAHIKFNFNDIGLYLRNPNINWWSALVGGAAAENLGATASYEMALGALAADAGIRLMRRAIPGGHNLSDVSKDFAYVYEAMKQLNL